MRAGEERLKQAAVTHRADLGSVDSCSLRLQRNVSLIHRNKQSKHGSHNERDASGLMRPDLRGTRSLKTMERYLFMNLRETKSKDAETILFV